MPLALRAIEHFVADEEAEKGYAIGPDVTAALTLEIELKDYTETRTFGAAISGQTAPRRR